MASRSFLDANYVRLMIYCQRSLYDFPSHFPSSSSNHFAHQFSTIYFFRRHNCFPFLSCCCFVNTEESCQQSNSVLYPIARDMWGTSRLFLGNDCKLYDRWHIDKWTMVRLVSVGEREREMINLCFMRDKIFRRKRLWHDIRKIYGWPQAKAFYHELVIEMSTLVFEMKYWTWICYQICWFKK